jgi:hypothetical protein
LNTNASTYAEIPGHSISMQECVALGNRMTARQVESALDLLIIDERTGAHKRSIWPIEYFHQLYWQSYAEKCGDSFGNKFK